MKDIEKNILYEDTEMIVCRKESGWLSQSDHSFEVDMVSALMNYRFMKGEPAYAAIINRLDRPVSGLVLFAKTRESAAKLTEALQKHSIDKYYYAVVCGKPETNKGILVDCIVKDAGHNVSRVAEASGGGKRAELEYEVLQERAEGENVYSLIRIHLLTGRHHQIRVQFAARGLPLLGDSKYGAGAPQLKRPAGIALCAYRLEINGRVFEMKPEGSGFELFSF